MSVCVFVCACLGACVHACLFACVVCVFSYNTLCKLFWEDCALRVYRILYLG